MNRYNKFFYVFYEWAKKRGRLSPYWEAATMVIIHHFLIGMLLFYMLVKFNFVRPVNPLWINFAIIMAVAIELHYVCIAPENEFEKIENFGEIESEPEFFTAFSWLWFVILALVSCVIPLMNGGLFPEE